MAIMTAAVRTTKNDNGDGSGKDEAIVVYYDAGDDSDNAGVFVAVARAAVDAAATAANQGDNDADCNEDPSTCASPATATCHAIVAPPLLGVVAYFRLSLDYKDKDKDNDNSFGERDVVGRGGTTMATKAIKSAAGNNFDDEDVVKGRLAEEIWKG